MMMELETELMTEIKLIKVGKLVIFEKEIKSNAISQFQNIKD
jgi:hypothetical protein